MNIENSLVDRCMKRASDLSGTPYTQYSLAEHCSRDMSNSIEQPSPGMGSLAHSIARFKLENANAEKRGLKILPSVDGPYAWNPITETVVGRKGSEAYRLATSQTAEPPTSR